jgi:hypothetical protein
MTTPHSDRHVERLLELAAADDDPRAAWKASELSDCSLCGAELEQWLAAQSHLAAVGQETRATLAAAAGVRSAPGEERNAAILRTLLERRAGRGQSPPIPADSTAAGPAVPSARRAPLIWFAIAAAAVLAILLVRRPWISTDPRDGQSLGGHALAAVEPSGTVTRWQVFRWDGRLPPRGWFVVRLHGATADGAVWNLESPHLSEHQWTPASTDGWPRAIEWEVHSFTASGEPFDSCSARAALAP